jgi:alpha-ribazole phosphatase
MRNYKLHLIRHSMTGANLENIYAGNKQDLNLCKRGIDLLNNLRNTYNYPQADKVYTSPLKRCMDTANIIYPDLPYTIVTDMRECNFGEFDGRKLDDLMHDQNFIKWLNPTSKYTPSGGESSEEFSARVVGGLNEILTDMMKNNIYTAAVITHGGVISTLLALTAFPRKSAEMWASDFGCGFTLETNTGMWSRDRALEAVAIIPRGYMDK